MILVTSPTSFVGRAVVRRLAAEEFNIRCLLQPSRYEQQLPRAVTFSIASAGFADVAALRAAMQDVTAVIHLSRGEERLEEQALQDQPVQTANLLSAAQEAGVTRLIYLSRLGATSASAYPLFRAKGDSEVEIHQSGLDYTVFRSAVVYGAEDAFTTRLVMLAKMSPLLLPIPDVGMARFQPVWVEDLARCVVATIDRDDLIGRTVPLGGPEHFTLEQMIRHVLGAAGMRRYLLHVGFEPCQFTRCLSYLRRQRPWRRAFIRHVLGY
jgi:uncharacterized protein YbjT (DUF2867 family)